MTRDVAFYMVLNRETGRSHVQHDTKEKAMSEATRLAIANPRQTFYVMVAIGKALVEPPRPYQEFETPDDMIPF